MCIVNFISFREMFQNIQQLAQKGTYETICQGTSVNVICYMLYVAEECLYRRGRKGARAKEWSVRVRFVWGIIYDPFSC